MAKVADQVLVVEAGRRNLALVEVGVLGGLRVSQSGAEVTVPGSKPRRLLALLVSQAGRDVPVDVLV